MSIELTDKIKAPLASNNVVGTLKISKDGVIIKEINRVVLQNINAITYGESLKEIISRW